MKFRKYNGEMINDVYEYVVDIVTSDPSINVAIGCDSAQLRHKTQYAVTVVTHSDYYKHGAHVVYSKFKIDKVKNRFNRLWKECEYVFDIAEEMHNNLEKAKYKRNNEKSFFKLVDVHLDLNPNALFGSNVVCTPALSWFKSLGYNTVLKPDSYAAMVAADRLCK